MSSEAQLEKQCKHEWPPSPRALIIPALLGFAVMLSGPFNAKGSDITDWPAIDLLAIKTLAITSLPHLPKDPLNSAAADSGRITATYTVKNDPFNCLGEFSDAKLPYQCQPIRNIEFDLPEHVGAFTSASLRGVAQRPPYMHNGQFATLNHNPSCLSEVN